MLVVGGISNGPIKHKTTELFDITTQTWSAGIDLPDAIVETALVGASTSSANAAFLISGVQDDQVSSRIVALNKHLTEWNEVSGSIKTPRARHIALQLPQNVMENC